MAGFWYDGAKNVVKHHIFSNIFFTSYPFKCQPHKMVKHTQTIRQQQLLPTNWLGVFDHFVRLALKRPIKYQITKLQIHFINHN